MSDFDRRHHGEYTLCIDGTATYYDAGAIASITSCREEESFCVEVSFRDGRTYHWKNPNFDGYLTQFGAAVSADGKKVFVQTWEKGLFCLDACTGQILWRTQSKSGITSVFVNSDTLVCHQHGKAIVLLDIQTGRVLKEKKPATAWGFTALDHQYIVCQVTARRWEVFHSESLEVLQAYTHKEFTDGHTDYCVQNIKLTPQGILVTGFKNVWDVSEKPAKMLPNLEFSHVLSCKLCEVRQADPS